MNKRICIWRTMLYYIALASIATMSYTLILVKLCIPNLVILMTIVIAICMFVLCNRAHISDIVTGKDSIFEEYIIHFFTFGDTKLGHTLRLWCYYWKNKDYNPSKRYDDPEIESTFTPSIRFIKETRYNEDGTSKEETEKEKEKVIRIKRYPKDIFDSNEL